MASKIDLHLHSTASDGADTPEVIVQKARELGLELIALTDHDTVNGLERAAQAAKQENIKFINGVELSVIFYHPLYQEGKKSVELHLLGYGFDPQNQKLRSVLEENAQYREWRAGEIIRRVNFRLAGENIPSIPEEEFVQFQKTIEGSIGRPHLAKLLIRKGIVQSIEEAFGKYLIKGDVPKRVMSFQEGSELARQAGGKIVLAHPLGDINYSLGKITPQLSLHREIIQSLRPYLDGLECFYWKHTPEQNEFYAQVARELELIITGGTDHHGGKESERIGQLSVPDYVADYFK